MLNGGMSTESSQTYLVHTVPSSTHFHCLHNRTEILWVDQYHWREIRKTTLPTHQFVSITPPLDEISGISISYRETKLENLEVFKTSFRQEMKIRVKFITIIDHKK